MKIVDIREVAKVPVIDLGIPAMGEYRDVYATLEDGSEKILFGYYTKELSFDKSELIGLTIQEAGNLYLKKDVAYLQS